ncbi:MAG: FAD-binding oxidoreductase, partial [Chloroflexi bacterium]|nr:FAD-binding oxidoreductase [Chloroflexota bacterium]
DARTVGYNFAFGLALSVLRIAKAHGGRAYSTGLYFAREAERVLGSQRLEALRRFKRQVDPQRIMNPGKVVDGFRVLPAFMGLAGALEPAVRFLGNRSAAPIGERIAGQGRRGIPDDVAWYAYTCSQCGYCVNPCDQYYGRGWESESPRAKWFFLREYMAGRAEFTQEWVDKFLACTTCELCNVTCPLELPNEPSWLAMRGELIQGRGKMTFPPFEVMRASLRKEHNIWGSYRHRRADWIPEDKKHMISERAEIGFFPGCTASYVEHDIAQATACLMHKAGLEFTALGEDEACCGIPMLVAGLWETFHEIMDHNIAAMKARGVHTVVTSCPACWLVWEHFYPEWHKRRGLPGEYPFQVRHYSEVLADALEAGTLTLDRPIPKRLTWHDSCHMGRAGSIYEPPRRLLQAIPQAEFVEMEHNREHGHCCGSVLSLVADPPAAARIGDIRLREADDVHADALVSTCPCCQVQLRVTAQKTGRDLPIIDLAHLLCEATGVEHADPTDYALEMWATFEAMIHLLKPEAMADLMAELFPQMFAAMPAPMVWMMKAAKRVPPMLSAMKPVMPAMLPALVPMLMPKVMPDMLAAVERRVPMPDEMKEQMPDLMPTAMERLLPNMLPQLAPFIVPRMIDYIREEL